METEECSGDGELTGFKTRFKLESGAVFDDRMPTCLAMATAVSMESPVIIETVIPALRRREIALDTPTTISKQITDRLSNN